MRINPMMTKVQSAFLDLEQKFNNKPIVFNIHPNEFIDESGEPRIISRRVSNFVSYLLADLLRSKLKIKNLGSNTTLIYKELIDYFYRKNYSFVSMKDYSKSLVL